MSIDREGAEKTDGAPDQSRPLIGVRALLAAASLSCAPIVAVAAFLGYGKFALATAAGACVCVGLYAFLRSFVVQLTSVVSPGSPREEVDAGSAAAKGLFAFGVIGKFIVTGLVLWVLIGVLKIDVFGFIAGFVASQIGMTIAAVKHLAKSDAR